MLITKSGLLDTIRDAGRYGYQHLGIHPGGAMDIVAMQLANVLVGNGLSEPVIEMFFPAAEIRFEETMLIALAGADLCAMINGMEAPILQPLVVQKGSQLRFSKQKKGTCVYLSVHGGFVAEEWLQSCSTNMQAKAGGLHGKALAKNDTIALKKKEHIRQDPDRPCKALGWKANVSKLYRDGRLCFIAGAEHASLTQNAKLQLQTNSFTISRESNRMGYRLLGEPLQLLSPGEMISTAVTRGTIQLLPDGQLIILMADHQTTGGYPRVGHITSADISSLAQMSAGESFSLQQTTLEEAESMLLQQEMNLLQLQNAAIFRLEQAQVLNK